jgi:catechol 2,3-dioxygenase-like lactoylglutathione lyase family enzyme
MNLYVRSLSRFAIVLGALFVLFSLAPFSIQGQSDVGTLRVSIREKSTREVVPAMICITSLADNTWRVPPDGTKPAGFLRNVDFIAARWLSVEHVGGDRKWFPGEPGPPLVMNGKFPDNITRDLWYNGGPAIPFWKEPAAYFVSQPFSITLPPGKWRLAVMRGFEYTPVYEEFTIAAGQTVSRDVQLARWTDMAKQGWYSCDPHVHSWRIAPVHDQYITTFAKAMNVHMTYTLSYCDRASCDGSIQAKYGKASRYHEGDYWLESASEDPREGIDEEGHVSQLAIQEPVRDEKKYQQYAYVFDGVHAQGGLAGYDHLAWSKTHFNRIDPQNAGLHPYPGWDVNINVIRGKVDFFSILQNNNLGLQDYYDFLNLGVKVTATASTDYPAPVVGEEITYAYTGTGGAFSPDAWYEACKRGRTFVTNGPMLSLTVGDALPGDELRPAKDAKVHIHAEARAPESIGAPKVLEIVAHGRVIRKAGSPNSKQDKLVVDFDLPAAESQWIAARTTAYNGAVAHTTPVYVIVDNKPFLDHANIKELVAKQLKVLDWIEQKRLDNPQFTRAWEPGVVNALWNDVEDARSRYVSLAAAPDRPLITGVANIAFKVSNLAAARDYYEHVLGYEQFSVSTGRSQDSPDMMYFKVNDRQYIQILPGLKDQGEDRLIHIGYETSDAEQLRAYLDTRGVTVPANVTRDRCGNLSFSIQDPDGHTVEFVQYLPDSIQSRLAGLYVPKSRISDHILHVGIHVKDAAKADKFYKDILGFRWLWEGGPEANPKAWVSYLVTNGTEWVEYMTTPNPNPRQLGGMHHVALEVMDIQKPHDTVIARGYHPPQRPNLARDGRWLENFYDPDGSRTEMMIRKPVEKPCCTVARDPYLPPIHPPRIAGAGGPRDLRCEKAVNPRGVKNAQPQLSWTMTARGPQVAYQIIVATSEEKLQSDEGDLWDSGKVLSSDASTQYRGRTLASLQRCYWKVRTWGNYYHSTGFSEIASWDMGLLLPESTR